jgi:hypothetical protein
MLESRQMRLLFKDYQSLPDGRVHLVPCTLVVLPDRNRLAGSGSPGRTLVLRAPQGAALEFDEPLDLKQGRLAKLIGGHLRGQVTIRGTPTAPGAEDDIEIVTRDVELDELEVRTVETVQFRYGRSSGSGRGLTPRPATAGRTSAVWTRSASTATCGCGWRGWPADCSRAGRLPRRRTPIAPRRPRRRCSSAATAACASTSRRT